MPLNLSRIPQDLSGPGFKPKIDIKRGPCATFPTRRMGASLPPALPSRAIAHPQEHHVVEGNCSKSPVNAAMPSEHSQIGGSSRPVLARQTRH